MKWGGCEKEQSVMDRVSNIYLIYYCKSKQCKHAFNVRKAYISTLSLSFLRLNIGVQYVLYACIVNSFSIVYFPQKYS